MSASRPQQQPADRPADRVESTPDITPDQKAAGSKSARASLTPEIVRSSRRAYATRGRAAALAQRLSERDLAILDTVDAFRVATGPQLEALHFADLSDRTRARRRRDVLARLARDDALERLDRRIGGVRAGSAGYLYVLGTLGQRILHPERRPRAVIDRHWHYLLHALATLDARVHLAEAEADQRLRVADFVVEPDCWHRSALGQTLKPDALTIVEHQQGTDYVWLEIDRATERPHTLRRKLREYTTAFNRGEALERAHVFPRVIWVVPSEERAAQLHALCEASAVPNLFAVCLVEDLAATIVAGPEGGAT